MTHETPFPVIDEHSEDVRERVARFLEALNTSPAYRLIGMRAVRAAGGRSRVELPVGETHKNLYGIVHGGLLATLMDSACGVAMGSLLREGESLVTLDLRINYLSPVRTGTLTAEGKAVHRGRKTGVAEASILDDAGRLVARGGATTFFQDSQAP